MTPSLALFAALLLAPLSTHAAHAATVEVVQSGKAVNLFPTDPGYVFETKDAQLFLKGDGLTFFAKAKLSGQFTLKARMTIEKADGEFEPAVTTLKGQPLRELKSTRVKEGFTLTLSSDALKQAFKPGSNDFSFTSHSQCHTHIFERARGAVNKMT